MNGSINQCFHEYVVNEIGTSIDKSMNEFKHKSSNRRSFRGPGGVGRGLDSVQRAQICAWELAYRVSRGLLWPPVVFRGLPPFRY